MGGLSCVFLPLFDRLERARAPLTLGVTPVLCDQLEALPRRRGRSVARLPARDAHARCTTEDERGLAHGSPRTGAEVRRAAGDYERAAAAFEARDRDLMGASARSRAWSCGPRRPPTRCCRCWPPTPGCAPARHGHRGRTSGASATWTGASGCRSAPTCRASSASWPTTACAPSASIRPALDMARSTSSSLATAAGAGGRADRLADGGVRLERPAPATPCIPPTATTTAAPCTTCVRGATAATPMTRRLRARSRASTRATSWGAPSGYLLPSAVGRAACALDTELLGHWWYEGQEWLCGVVEEARSAASTWSR